MRRLSQEPGAIPLPAKAGSPLVAFFVVTVLRKHAFRHKPGSWSKFDSKRREYLPTAYARRVMGIPPGVMSRAQVGEAIPPAYAEYIGRHVMRLL